jgi:membrane-associated phospholipid phosphatase
MMKRKIRSISVVGTLGLLICLGLIGLIEKLVREVWEKESFSFDTTFLLWIHQFANPITDRVMLAITQLGNPNVVIPIAIITLIFLWLDRHYSEAKFFAIACLGGAILNTGLKLVFRKSRPALWHRLIEETSYSFPSGHALGAVVLYGAIAYLGSEYYPRFAGWIYGGAIALIVLIGLSRLYLGVHWPTDVMAGYSVGSLWLMICIGMLNRQRQQKKSR